VTFPPNTIWNTPPNMWFEAIRLKNGTIIFDSTANHWGLMNTYWHRIRDRNNIESIGIIEFDGTYTVKERGSGLQNWFENK